ncbi:ty3-gypsy retrotransposon protein [Cucumis melo var. makuwa]|uniref:Ty3-gypsy retrotransposon protein n=1 Tax=Cucumis melo var. makuwa TaxID=1194695 RepID=A0A5D3BE93_CUCMM|nr:ty3-gypsy retrotransposon protein [Cucumis melo var. makuwa]
MASKKDQESNVAQSILKQLMESSKARIVLKENPLYDKFNYASSKSKKEAHSNVMPVMMTDIMAEAAMAETERKVNFLMKVVEEQDHEITTLREQMQTHEIAESSQTLVVKAIDKGKNVVQENQPQQQSVFVPSLSVQKLQDMIANSIRAQYGGPLQTTLMYSKPYTKRIDNSRMPLGYQPEKFQQFDGKSNPKQHIAHFVETCENAESRGDQLVRKFVRSLKGNAFKCRGTKDFSVSEVRKDKKETKSVENVVKSTVKESMVVNTTPLKFLKRKEGRAEKKDDGSERRRMTLKERQEKVYPFPDSDISNMLKQLLEKQLIQLPECKRPVQAGKVDDSNYYRARPGGGSPNKPCCSNDSVRGSFAKIDFWAKEKLGPTRNLRACSDAKFYLKNDNSTEVVPLEIPLVNEEDNLQQKSFASREPHKSTRTFHSGMGEVSTSTIKSMILMDEKTSNPPILRYVPLSRRKKGESLFVESAQGLKVGDIEVLKETFTTQLTKITKQEIKIDLIEQACLKGG